MLPADARAGRWRRKGDQGSATCASAGWCRGTVLRTGGGRWGEGEARRPEGSAPPCAFAWSGASFLPLPREEEAATEVCTGRGSTATEVCTGRGRGSKLSKQGRRGRISQCTGTLKKCRSSSGADAQLSAPLYSHRLRSRRRIVSVMAHMQSCGEQGEVRV